MKKLKTTNPFFGLILIAYIFLASCKKKNFRDSLELDCSQEVRFSNLKTTLEPKGNFKINIPTHWKKEFFISEKESRLYFADTTKQLNESYIIDIALHQNKKILDSEFLNKKLDSIKTTKHLKLINSKKIIFQEKPGYLFHTRRNNYGIDKNTFDIFLQNRDRSYYLIRIDMYGDSNQTTRLCEALALIEKGNFY